jgi:hypothetical protein
VDKQATLVAASSYKVNITFKFLTREDGAVMGSKGEVRKHMKTKMTDSSTNE